MSWNRTKHFGFVRTELEDNVFVPPGALAGGLQALRVGDVVEVEAVPQNGSLRATRVKRL